MINWASPTIRNNICKAGRRPDHKPFNKIAMALLYIEAKGVPIFRKKKFRALSVAKLLIDRQSMRYLGRLCPRGLQPFIESREQLTAQTCMLASTFDRLRKPTISDKPASLNEVTSEQRPRGGRFDRVAR